MDQLLLTSPNLPRQKRLLKNCAKCGKLFKPRSDKKRAGIYCSAICYGRNYHKRQIVCSHPDRIHKGRGMCDSCYIMWKRSINPHGKENHNRNQRAYTARWKHEKSEKWSFVRWQDSLRQLYKITPDDYFRMFENQNGKCFLCRKPPDGKKRLQVDHDHKTGKVRGLLCRQCNLFVGQIESFQNLLPIVLDYIKRGVE